MLEKPPEIRAKPPCSRKDALAVLKRLREAGHIAYFAGGCVRDVLLGLEPKDWDVATDAPPKRVRQLFSNTQAVGAVFGVILVKHGRSIVEVATFRSEGAYEDGRRPSKVTFTTAEEDAKRRDFTINGLFLNPLDNNHVIDYVGGVADLNARVLRAIGKAHERFAEDHLRLLRAVRFAARFDFRIDEQTAEAIARDSAKLKRISPERIADELRLMLTGPTRGQAWKMLWGFGLNQVIFRFLPPHDTPAAFDPNRSIFMNVGNGEGIGFGLALAAACVDVRWQAMGRPEDVRPWLTKAGVREAAKAMRQALKISNDELDEMEGTLKGAGMMLEETRPGVAGMKRFLACPTARQSRHLMDALKNLGLHPERITWLRGQLTNLGKTDFAPPPLITGDDLTAAGLPPGPLFKRILDQTYDAQLEGKITSKDEAMELAKKIQ